MPIKGLTDRGLSFPEIGQIRKGAKKTDNAPGKDLTHFRVEFDEKEVKAAEAFLAAYGPEPTAIRIILPFNDIDRMWDAWLEAYTAGRMVARSDGEKFTFLVDVKTGEILVKNGLDVKTGQPRAYQDGVPVGFYESRGKQEPIKLRPVGRLKVIVPELARAAYLTVMTTSIHDIANISAQLEAFAKLNNGQIAGIPFILRRRPKKISTPGPDGKRVRRVKWLLSIEADPDWVKRMLGHLNTLALPALTDNPALLGDGDDPDEVEGEVMYDFEDDEYDEPEDEQEHQPPLAEQGTFAIPEAMSLEEAENVTNAQGVRYGDMDSAALRTMGVNIRKAKINAQGEVLDELEYKRQAIDTLLRIRGEETAI